MRWRFNGDTCCACGASCPQQCLCQIGEWFDFTNGPNEIAVADIVVPASYRYYSAEYVYPCPQENCDDLNAGDAPLQYVTPHHKVGYKSFGSFVLTKDETLSDEFVCGWSADITGVPNATTADECWGQNFNGLGTKESPDSVDPTSISGLCPTNAYWSYCPSASPVDGNTLLEYQSPAQGLGEKLFSGLRRIELVTSTYACGRPTLRLYPQQVWSPLKSDVVPTATVSNFICPTVQNPVSEMLGVENRYWEIDGWQVDEWDSSAQIFTTASFDMGLRVKDGSSETPYGAFGKDLETVMEYPIDEQMPMGSAFPCDNCGATGNAGNCGLGDDFLEIPSDASYVPVTGTEKCGATVFTNTGDMCQCWSDPDGVGIGCLPFPKSGYQPDESELITDFALRIGGDIWVQNGTSYWGLEFIYIPTSGGLVYLGPKAGNRRVQLYISGTPSEYILDSCGGEGVTVRGESGTDFFTMTMPYGGDCNECVDTSVTVGCCEFADGTVSTTLGEIPCTDLGGTYAGDDSVCPPTGCCTLPDTSVESNVTEAYCTAQSGSWVSGDCPAIPTGCCSIVGSPDQSGTTQAECTALGGTWTEGVDCAAAGYCQDPSTGVVTSGVEENDCTGTWSATPFPTGCCAITGGPDQPNKNQVECSVLGGTWTEGANCDGTGWCINDTDGSVTSGVEQNDCTGTWSATQPTTGCCVVSGTNHEGVAQQWCTAQGGTFTLGACPLPTFDPCAEAWTIVSNGITIDMDDPFFDLANPLTMSGGIWLQPSNAFRHDVCSSFGAQLQAGAVNINGDNTANPTQISAASTTSVKYNSGTGNWNVETHITWVYQSNTYTITATKNNISLPSAGCPSFTISGAYDNFVSNYSQIGNGFTFDQDNMVGSFNLTLTCE